MAKKNKHMRIHQTFPEPGNDQAAHLGSQSQMPMGGGMPQMAPGADINSPGQPPNPADVLGSSGY
jgi:hypothetical protein